MQEAVQTMPKIELHRHLEGSLRLTTLLDIALAEGVQLPTPVYSVEDMRPYVQMMPHEPRSWQHFMHKFTVLRQFFLSEAIIRRIAREAVEDAARDNVKYMELRFTPYALSHLINCETREVVSWVCEAVQAAAQEQQIMVRLIVSVNRHESVEIAEEGAQAAIDHQHLGVVGLDLAGIEPGYAAHPFRQVFKRARSAGLGITLHAGEWQGAQSVWDAISNIGADRIGHGIRTLEDSGIMQVLIERGIALEVCPSSNVETGAHSDLSSHPLPQLIAHGVKVTINTDDPLVFGVTLSDELRRAVEYMPLTLDDLKRQTIVAAESAFLPPAERAALVNQYKEWLYV
ncbi:MAG: adenosine deaminase [Anaerolineae bacterium]